jgi:ABC-2 type transport system permease protein
VAAKTEPALPEQVAPAGSDGGVIHNIGYREYDGVRLGRGPIFVALMWHSLRTAFGFGRGAKAKIFPALLFVIMCLPAVVNAVSLATNPHGGAIITYDDYVPSIRTVAMLIFVAIEAPNLVSADLRNHMLPLYFARPIGRIDYPLAKLVAFVIACLLMIEIPLVILYVGNVTQVHGAHAVWEQTLQFGPGLLYGAAWAVLLASIGLLLASTSGKRVFAICAVAIPLFFSYIVAHVLEQVGRQAFRAVPVCGGKVVRHAGQVICLHPGVHPPALASLAGLISPFTLLGGLLHWLGAPNFTPAGNLQATVIGQYGDIYGLVFVLLTLAAVGGLILRYRKVGVA